ncbi:MAG: hypothetical protein VYE29_05815 [Pseudomonadota bacterium]|nr:hypothetical protein [Pseudomonadota bacterium]
MLCKYPTQKTRIGYMTLFVALALLSLSSNAAQPDTADTFQEWSAETRTSLSFQVNAEAVKPLLADGWVVPVVAENPDRVNLTVTFMDRHIVLDADGDAIGSGTSRYMVMSVQGRNHSDGQTSILIINGISPEGAGAYEVYQAAQEASAQRLVWGNGEQVGQVEETWQMTAESGDSIRLHLQYQPAVPVLREPTLVIRSAKNTGYTRTYRIEQASDALGVPGETDSRLQGFEFTASGPLFSRIFDGTEVLQGVTSTPWYHREIYVP